MKVYGTRLKYETAIKDFRFINEDDELADEKWDEANERLEEVGDRSISAADFFQNAVKHYAEYGFIRVEK